MKSLSHVWLLVTPWTAAHQAPPSMGFSRQEYKSGCHCLLRIFSLVHEKPYLLFSNVDCNWDTICHMGVVSKPCYVLSPSIFLPPCDKCLSDTYYMTGNWIGPTLVVSQLHLTYTWGSPGSPAPLLKPAGGLGSMWLSSLLVPVGYGFSVFLELKYYCWEF